MSFLGTIFGKKKEVPAETVVEASTLDAAEIKVLIQEHFSAKYYNSIGVIGVKLTKIDGVMILDVTAGNPKKMIGPGGKVVRRLAGELSTKYDTKFKINVLKG